MITGSGWSGTVVFPARVPGYFPDPDQPGYYYSRLKKE
jgi:hypothetical protein